MIANELQMGDIIFYQDTNGIPEHMAIYLCKKEETHYVAHATTEPHRGVMITYLREPDFSCHYHIIRPQDQKLARVAIGIILNWVEQKIPFTTDARRFALLDTLEEKNGYSPKYARLVQEQHAKATYVENYLHYLNMANALPSIPEEGGIIAGLACSETIIAAFNIALLLNHATYNPKSSTPTQRFSLSNFSEAFITNLKNPLPLDARAVAPAGIFEHCLNSPEYWVDKGILENYAPAPPTQKQKDEWKEFIAEFKQYEPTIPSPSHLLEILVPEEEDDMLEEDSRVAQSPSPLIFLNASSTSSDDSPTIARSRCLSSPYSFLRLNSPSSVGVSRKRTRSAPAIDSTSSMLVSMMSSELPPILSTQVSKTSDVIRSHIMLKPQDFIEKANLTIDNNKSTSSLSL